MDYPQRKPARLKNYDYSTPGAYFVTVCTREKRCILSRVVKPSGGTVGAGVLDGPQVQLSALGRIVDDAIREMGAHYGFLSFDRYVIMPNHIHLLISITEHGPSGTPAPTNATIPALISYLKRRTNRQNGKSLWQRSFYDHVVRSEAEYREIAEYIAVNPARWAEDRFFVPEGTSG